MGSTDAAGRRGRLGLAATVVAALVVGAAWWMTRGAAEAGVDVVTPVARGTAVSPVVDGRAAANTPSAAPAERIDAPVADPEVDDTSARASTGLVLGGRVVDPDGAPIAGARVALHAGRDTDDEPDAETRTDDAGRFHFEDVPDEDLVHVVASAAGHTRRAFQFARGHWPDEIELRLGWTAGLSGRVTDGETDRPLAEVAVSCGGRNATSDVDGRYRLDGVSVGWDHDLVAQVDGYARAILPVHLAERRDAEVDVPMERGLRLVVEVVDAETGRPLPDVELRRRHASAPTPTDAHGRHALIVADGEAIALDLAGPDHAPATWSAELRAPWPDPIRLPLLRPARIVGRVIDAVVDAPAPGAQLWVPGADAFLGRSGDMEVDFDGPGAVRSRLEGSAESDTDGRFEIRLLPSSDERTVHCRVEGRAAVPVGPFVLDAPGASVTVDVVVEEAGTIRGRVRMGDEVWPKGRARWSSLRADVSGSAPVDEHGVYELRDVLPGPVELTVQRAFLDESEPLTTSLDVRAGEVHEHDVDWPAVVTAPITGHVVNEDGTPAAGVSVAAYGADGGYLRGGRSGDDGTYRLDPAVDTTWRVSAREGVRSAVVTDVAAGTTGVDLVLPTFGHLRLRLVDADTSEPVRFDHFGRRGGHPVSWRASGETAFGRASSGSDVDGFVDLALPLATGPVDVLVAAPGYEPHRVDALTLSAEADPRAHRVELRRGLDVRLTPDGTADRSLLEGHLVFLMHTDERDDIGGPYERGDEHSNWRFNGQHIFLGRPYFPERLVSFRHGIDVVSGLRAGRHEFVVMPDDVVFDPPAIDVTPQRTEHAVSWTSR